LSRDGAAASGVAAGAAGAGFVAASARTENLI
jgi:hypothetical protein